MLKFFGLFPTAIKLKRISYFIVIVPKVTDKFEKHFFKSKTVMTTVITMLTVVDVRILRTVIK